MLTRELAIPDVFVFEPEVHPDDRGQFLEWMTTDALRAATGRSLRLAQANLSVSRRGVVRGIHLAMVPPGQAKYATVVAGRVLDIAVDLRVGSPAFATADSVVLDEERRAAVFLPEGIGHVFVALSASATLCYLVDEPYAPEREFTISPLDDDLGLDFRLNRSELVLSDRDRDAPSLREVMDRGMLPTWDECRTAYAEER